MSSPGAVAGLVTQNPNLQSVSPGLLAHGQDFLQPHGQAWISSASPKQSFDFSNQPLQLVTVKLSVCVVVAHSCVAAHDEFDLGSVA